jgi:predicted  nucleic acid-binding Zn-ribbon protein
MASIRQFFKSSTNKRDRQDSSNSECSSSSTKSPPKKKVDVNISKDSNDSFLTYLENIEENMEYVTEQFEGCQDMPTWAKHMYGKLCSINNTQQETRDKIDSFLSGMDILDHKVNEVILESKESTDQVRVLTSEIALLKGENGFLKAKLIEQEDYSKKYNIKIFNINENIKETPHELRGKLAEILEGMDLNIKDFYIDIVHRLPNNGQGPRPVIVKFVSASDRNLVWSRRSRLSHTNLQFREHFSKQTEEKIKVLLPIRRAAIDSNMRTKLVADKLYINNTMYQVSSLASLPDCLQQARFGCKEIEDKHFFFSSSSPLSNFHPSPFMVDGVNFSCGEQFLQWKKARLFECNDIASEILAAKAPAHMKRLGGKLRNFNKSTWSDAIPEIARTCLDNKF